MNVTFNFTLPLRLYVEGKNSIVIYMCHEVFHNYFPVQFQVANTHAAWIAVNIWGTALWTIIAAYLYWKNVFIAVWNLPLPPVDSVQIMKEKSKD